MRFRKLLMVFKHLASKRPDLLGLWIRRSQRCSGRLLEPVLRARRYARRCCICSS